MSHRILYCFPHAGGSGSSFRALEVGPDVELIRADYPGHLARLTEPLTESVPDLAQRLFDEWDIAADASVTLFGVSMGALVANEVAMRLSAEGHPPARLLVASCHAPGRMRPLAVSDMNDDELVAFARQRYGGRSNAALVHPEVRDLALPILRHDLRMVSEYRPEPRLLPCGITAIRGVADESVTAAEMNHWLNLTSAGGTMVEIAADHFVQESAAATVSLILRDAG